MFVPAETFLGLDASIVLLATAILAAIGTFGSMLIILFLTFAPYVSERWDNELGAAVERVTPTRQE